MPRGAKNQGALPTSSARPERQGVFAHGPERSRVVAPAPRGPRPAARPPTVSQKGCPPSRARACNNVQPRA
eukprot:7997526-Prorocentrum_lima.AAC.1